MRGFVHRDVRWPNVLQTVQGQWLLADFELADVSGAALPPDAVATAFLPPEGGPYKFTGDVYRVGRLIFEWEEATGKSATAAARKFANLLAAVGPTDRPTASIALSDEWLAIT